MDAFEADLWRSIAAAPNVPGPRGVLADHYLERGSPWGEYMNAERFGQTTTANELRGAARVDMHAALGGGVEVAQTWLGLPDRVVVSGDEVDPTRLPWGVVSQLDFSLQVRDRVRLLEQGRQAHGWPRLDSLSRVTLDELWSLRPWSNGRFRSLALAGLGSALPSALTSLLAPRPSRLTFANEGLQVVFRDELPEVWVTCLPPFPFELLVAVLGHGLVEGETLYWVNGLPSAEVRERLAAVLPAHTHAVLPEGLARGFG